ncbi:MAG: aspartate kinase [archaeon]
MTNIIVSKFGGTSVKNVEKIIEDDYRRRVIVVSAPENVTDLLIQLANTKNLSIINEILSKYEQFASQQSIIDLKQTLEYQVKNSIPNYSENLQAIGEKFCAKMIAKKLGLEYVDPSKLFLVTDTEHPKILPSSKDKIQRTIKGNKRVVVPGYYAYTSKKLIRTLGRGGSDMSGAYIAAALGAECYEKFTDRQGILAADPNIVKNPKKIEEMTFRELRDLAYLGFNIFHPKAMGCLDEMRVPLHVRHAGKYPSEGTYVVHDRLSNSNQPIIGVAYKPGFCSFNIEYFGMNEEVGTLRKILQVFEKENVSVEFIPGIIDDISVVLRKEQLNEKGRTQRIFDSLYNLLGPRSGIDLQENIGCMVVGGKGLQDNPVLTARLHLTLAQNGIDVRPLALGAKRRSIVYVVNDCDSSKAVNLIYDKYLR